MILKVDPDELQDVTKVMRKDVELFKREISNMENSLGVISNNWGGKDADNFIGNFSNFINKVKYIPKALESLAEISSKTSQGYVSRDEQFAKDLREGAVVNE